MCGTHIVLGIMMCATVQSVFARQDVRATATAVPAAAKEDGATEQQLDRVIAVVNNQVILASDLDLEIRLIQLLPANDRNGIRRDSSPPKALERLTTRALIDQQILQEDPHGLEIAPRDLEASLTELRQDLPACKQRDCNSPAGWSAYLSTLGLTSERVADYWSHRMAVLKFIEERFRSGIRISPEEIQKYYGETLAPQYAKAADVPTLARVSPRIQEILLQQQVTALFNDWLKSLQDQGQVEILDSQLAAAVKQAGTPSSGPPKPAPVPVPVPAPQPPAPSTPPPGKGGEL
jgi:peptidyl-prolyl cis-trans isomerase SurA